RTPARPDRGARSPTPRPARRGPSAARPGSRPTAAASPRATPAHPMGPRSASSRRPAPSARPSPLWPPPPTPPPSTPPHRATAQASQQAFAVLVAGSVVGPFPPAGISFQSYATAAFTVAAGAHTISFQGLDTAGGDNTAFLDAVAVAPVGAPVIGDQGF